MVALNKDNKRLVTESNFIKEAVKNNLTLNEFLLLVYFDNAFDPVFDPSLISKVISLDENNILEAYSSLLKKKLIKVKAVKDGYNKISEKVYLDNFYNDILIQNKEANKGQQKENIFSIFENEFGRTLSSMDYEIINAWIEKGFSEEMVIAALKEAVYNGVTNLRYIDKVLYEWNRKGYKTVSDVNNGLTKEAAPVMLETSILNYDWLDEK